MDGHRRGGGRAARTQRAQGHGGDARLPHTHAGGLQHGGLGTALSSANILIFFYVFVHTFVKILIYIIWLASQLSLSSYIRMREPGMWQYSVKTLRSPVFVFLRHSVLSGTTQRCIYLVATTKAMTNLLSMSKILIAL